MVPPFTVMAGSPGKPIRANASVSSDLVESFSGLNLEEYLKYSVKISSRSWLHLTIVLHLIFHVSSLPDNCVKSFMYFALMIVHKTRVSASLDLDCKNIFPLKYIDC